VTRRRTALAAAGVVVILLAAWGLTQVLERVMVRPAEQTAEAGTARPEQAQAPVRHITATLFYGSQDGQQLVAIQREVPFGEGSVDQGRQILLAQLTLAPPAPQAAVIPKGTTLRSFHVTESGDAFIDLGPEIVASHPGGSAGELLTVYALVNAVTANLPAVRRVQILVDGKEVDSLAGHVDLRRPLQRNDALVR
jgi:germination protein M